MENRKQLKVFTFESAPVRTIERDGEAWFVLKDVCRILGIENHKDIQRRLDPDEVGRFDIPHPQNNAKTIKVLVVNEPGLYNVILRSDKPQAKAFKRWITHDVLPAIRKTGEYKTPAKAMTDYQQMQAETRRHNIAIQKARLLNQIAGQYDGPYRQVLQAHATRELTGEFLLPLPQMAERTFSAAEIGEMLGISAAKVGSLTNRNGLKNDQYGAWFYDKARGADKQVQTFRYYQSVLSPLRSLLDEGRA